MHFSSRAALVALFTFVLFTISNAVQAQAVWQAGTGSESGNAYFGGNVGIGAWPSTFPLNVQKTGQVVAGSTSAYLLAAFGSPAGNQGTFLGYDGGASGTSSIGIVGSTGYSSSLAFWTGNGGTGFLERMRITSAGDFGIGNPVPVGILHIERNQNAMTSVFVRNMNTGTSVPLGNARYVAQTEGGAMTLEQMSSTFTNGGARQANAGAVIASGFGGMSIATTSGDLRVYTGGVANERMRITSAGQIGIGTGGATLNALLTVSGAGARTLFQDMSSGSTIRIIPGGDPTYSIIDAVSLDQASSRVLVLQPNGGNVGIGTTTPAARLDVVGGIAASGNITAGGTITAAGALTATAGLTASAVTTAASGGLNLTASTGAIHFYAGSTSSERMILDSTGKVGIGTSAPLGTLHVRGAGATSLFENSAVATTVRISPSTAAYAQIDAYDNTNPANPRNLILQPTLGFVGIGTSTPSAKLDVNGDINVSGNINAKYQDVAEWVVTAEPLTAGTVVVLSRNVSNVVTASSEAYDTTVAGVVSAQPGITLGERGDDKAKIATTGRVKVHVDASNGPIAIGDLLVTSGQRGTAMKSQMVDLGGLKIHRPGTIVGKALEPLASGEGEILVLLTLQ